MQSLHQVNMVKGRIEQTVNAMLSCKHGLAITVLNNAAHLLYTLAEAYDLTVGLT